MRKTITLVIAFCLLTSTIVAIPFVISDSEYVTYHENKNTYIVKPTGADDTENIKYALDSAVDSSPGSIVKLTSGTFYLSEPIQIADFDGTFKGAGKKATVVRNMEGIIFPLAEPPVGRWPFFFVFYLHEKGGVPSDNMDITISDMTLQVHGISEQWTIELPFMLWDDGEGGKETAKIPFSDFNPLCIIGKYSGETESKEYDGVEYVYEAHSGEHGYYDVSVKRLQIEGVDNYDWVWGGQRSNIHNGICIQGWLETNPMVDEGVFAFHGILPLTGDIEIRDCTFLNTQYGAYFSDQVSSNIDIRNNVFTGDGTDSLNEIGIELSTFEDCEVKIHRNKMEAYDYGIKAYTDEDDVMVCYNKISANIAGVQMASSGWMVKKNVFLNMAEDAVASIWCMGDSNTIMKNNYVPSHQPGWTEETPTGPGAVLLYSGDEPDPEDEEYVVDYAENNIIKEKNGFPYGTKVYSQVLDMGQNNDVYYRPDSFDHSEAIKDAVRALLE